MKTKLVVVLMIIVCLGAAIAGFLILGNKANDTDDYLSNTKTDDVEEEVEEESKGDYSLLTNEHIDHELVNRRPISLMIEHSRNAAPQYGINRAGIVYECPMEGGMTRTMGIFDDYSGMDRFGNVRSARPYFIYLASEYDSIYFHYGQSVQGEELLDTGIIDDINGLDGSVENIAYYRSDDRRAPHNAYTSTEGIDRSIEEKGYDREYDSSYLNGHFFFADSPDDEDDSNQNMLAEGRPAQALKLYYPDPDGRFVYYPKTKNYRRYDFGDRAVDGIDGNQVAVKNIILEYVECSLYDENGPGYLNIPVTGMGKGMFFTNGRCIDITWEKYADTERTKYYYPSGDEIVLNTGKTWICLIEEDKADKNQIYETKEEYEEANGIQEEE